MPVYKRKDILAVCNRIINEIDELIQNNVDVEIDVPWQRDSAAFIKAAVEISSDEEIYFTIDEISHILNYLQNDYKCD